MRLLLSNRFTIPFEGTRVSCKGLMSINVYCCHSCDVYIVSESGKRVHFQLCFILYGNTHNGIATGQLWYILITLKFKRRFILNHFGKVDYSIKKKSNLFAKVSANHIFVSVFSYTLRFYIQYSSFDVRINFNNSKNLKL